MKCCEKCFSSPYLKEIISSNSDKGNCDFCKSEDVIIINPPLLINYFRAIFDLYEPVYNLRDFPSAMNIENMILKDFRNKIFTIKDSNIILELLKEIVVNEMDNYNELFNNKVYLRCLTDIHAISKANNIYFQWDKFCNEIISENRFHLVNAIDLIQLEKLLHQHSRIIKKGEIFFRARISEDLKGYPCNEMSSPPPEKATAGRANPEGISYLYLSSNEDTTLFEIRASLYDYVTIAKSHLLKDLTVINLREPDLYDPIQLAELEQLEEFILHKPFITKLSIELSKPNRRFDKDREYLPTQYLSEFIKSLGYDGVEYKSSVSTSGYNLAAFNSDNFHCEGTIIKEIEKVDYQSKPI